MLKIITVDVAAITSLSYRHGYYAQTVTPATATTTESDYVPPMPSAAPQVPTATEFDDTQPILNPVPLMPTTESDYVPPMPSPAPQMLTTESDYVPPTPASEVNMDDL